MSFLRPKVAIASALVLLSFIALLEAWPFASVSALEYGSAIQLVNGQSQPVGITVGLNGTVYWADYGSGQILKLNSGSSSPEVLLRGLGNPQGVGIDPAGNLYYDEYFAGTLSELPAGSSTPQVLATGLDYPNFMSVATNGTIFLITGQTAGDKIVRVNPNTGALTTIVAAPTQDTNYGFSGVFIHPSGDLYYSMIGYNTIYRLPAGSSTPEVVLSQLSEPIRHPNDVWVDGAGNIFYALYYDSVNVLPEGNSTSIVLTFAGSSRCQIAVDTNDNVFYTDNIGGVVWEVPAVSPLPNSLATVATTITAPVTVSLPPSQVATELTSAVLVLTLEQVYTITIVILGVALTVSIVLLIRAKRKPR